MRERARTDGGLLQTGVDIACRLGQLAACRHFDVGTTGLNRSDPASRLVEHDAACGHDVTVEPEQHDASAFGQHFATEVNGGAAA
jgi:hypothetical protein